MQAIAASVAATAHSCPTWLKAVARGAFVILFIKSVIWLGAWWLAFRGFDAL